ncbi:MAG: hypothetical protein ACRCUM_00070 [Mycoplasmoidaceae bacterium]
MKTFDTLEDALSEIKRLTKKVERQEKELENFDILKEDKIKLEKEIARFKKEQAEIAFQLEQKEKLEILKELKFDEKNFKHLEKLTKDIPIEDLKKELESDEYAVFKALKESPTKTSIVEKKVETDEEKFKNKDANELVNDYLNQNAN